MHIMNLFHKLLNHALFLASVLLAGVAGTGNVHAVTTTPGVGTGYNGLGQGPAPVILGLAGEYGILAKTTVPQTGTTAIAGNVCISPAPASSLTGFHLWASPSNTRAAYTAASNCPSCVQPAPSKRATCCAASLPVCWKFPTATTPPA